METDALNYILGQSFMRSKFKKWVDLKTEDPPSPLRNKHIVKKKRHAISIYQLKISN